MPPFSQSKSAQASQDFLPIETIRDGVIVLKHGQGLRAVLMVSGHNFALKSEEEQDAITFQYENFLNSLDFSLQFVIHSRRLNIQPYLVQLSERKKEETNELLKVQIDEYVEFVKTFIDLAHIVAKTFFVVVPFQPSLVERRRGILAAFLGRASGGAAKPDGAEEEEFTQFKLQLLQRVDTLGAGLRRLGLREALLGTEELIELFYGLYNPTEAQKIHEAAGGPQPGRDERP